MAKKLILGLIFVCFGPNLVPKNFFHGFYLYQILNIVASYHCIHFFFFEKNKQKHSFGSNFGLFLPKFGPQKYSCGLYLYQMLCIVASYHQMQFQGKLMNQTRENKQKPSFGTLFGHFGPKLGHKSFFRGFHLYQMLDIVANYHYMQFQEKLMNMRKWQKIWFWARFWPIQPKFGPLKLFFKNLAPSVTRCQGQLSSCKMSKKLMIQS